MTFSDEWRGKIEMTQKVLYYTYSYKYKKVHHTKKKRKGAGMAYNLHVSAPKPNPDMSPVKKLDWIIGDRSELCNREGDWFRLGLWSKRNAKAWEQGKSVGSRRESENPKHKPYSFTPSLQFLHARKLLLSIGNFQESFLLPNLGFMCIRLSVFQLGHSFGWLFIWINYCYYCYYLFLNFDPCSLFCFTILIRSIPVWRGYALVSLVCSLIKLLFQQQNLHCLGINLWSQIMDLVTSCKVSVALFVVCFI